MLYSTCFHEPRKSQSREAGLDRPVTISWGTPRRGHSSRFPPAAASILTLLRVPFTGRGLVNWLRCALPDGGLAILVQAIDVIGAELAASAEQKRAVP